MASKKRKSRRSRSSRGARRHGNAAAGPRVIYRAPTGLLVWSIPGSKLQIIWGGPGSALRMTWDAFTAGGSMWKIDHSSADGNYRTAKEATAAVKRFVAAGNEGEAPLCARCGKTAGGCRCVGSGGESGPFHTAGNRRSRRTSRRA